MNTMTLGIFAKTFERPTVEGVFEAVKSHGLNCVQFNMSCAGLPSMADTIDPAVVSRIRDATQHYGIEIAAVSGTYNMIHPDLQVRQQGLNRLRTLAAACQGLGTNVITLCTGTRDPADMWRWHPENTAPEAWSDLMHAMAAALTIAETYQVTLAFEPERSNVIYNAERGRALLRAMHSSRLKVVIDAANLIVPSEKLDMRQVLNDTFALLGDQIIMAHAKDRGADDSFKAAGEGVLDYDHYLHCLQKQGFTGPVIVHGLAETQVDASLQFLNSKRQNK